MSLTSTVYPSATGSRFEHSLGTMHLARLACESIFANSREASRKLLRCIGDEYPGIGAADTEHVVQDAVGAVGLTHDLGHPPFSHALETDFGRLARGWFTNLPMPYEETGTAFHEIATHHLLGAVVIADLSDESGSFRADLDDGEWQRYSAFLDLVLRIATADPDQPDWAGTLHGIVAGELDVDRLDYIMRDAQRAGTEYGSIDHYRLLQNMELAITDERSPAFSLGIGVRARSAAETLLLQRSQSYRWIVFHHRVVASNEALRRAFRGALRLSEGSEQAWGSDDATTDARQRFAIDLTRLRYIDPPTDAEAASARTHATVVSAAAVDDGAVTQLLYEKLLSAESMVASATKTGVEPPLMVLRFRSYARTALLREARMHPAWRTSESQARVTNHVLRDAGLRTQLTNAVNELHVAYGQHRRADAFLARSADEVLKDLLSEDRSQQGFNAVCELALGYPRYRNQLEELLRETTSSGSLAKWPHDWAVTYAYWSSLRSHGREATIFVSDDAEPLWRGSPMIAAMRAADELRLSTMIFYVMCDVDDGLTIQHREWFKNLIREAVRHTLPEFLRSVWIAALDERAARYAA